MSASIAGSVPEADGPVPSFLARANPLSKLIALLVVTAALAVTVDWVSATVVLSCALLILPCAAISPLALARRAWVLLLALVLSAWGTAVGAPDSGRTLLEFGWVTVSEGSLRAGIAIGARGLAMALPAVIVLSSTDPTDVANALAQRARFPHRFVLGALAAMRLVEVFAHEWRTLGMARRARGVGGQRTLVGRAQVTFSQGIALLVQAVRRGTRLALTMEAKGFGAGPRTWARRSELTWRDPLVVAAGLVIAVGATLAAMAAGTYHVIW